jgi:hypothetical protein
MREKILRDMNMNMDMAGTCMSRKTAKEGGPPHEPALPSATRRLELYMLNACEK